MSLFESDIEQYVIELLQSQGFEYLSPEEQAAERQSPGEVVLVNRLRNAVDMLNPGIPEETRVQALRQVLHLPSQNLIDNNEAFHRMLTEGVEVEYLVDGTVRGDKVRLIDFEEVRNNEFLVCNQFTVTENNITKRPDVVLFVNGLPLAVMELKNPADENATIAKAFTQLQNYKSAIPSLFHYNAVLAVSDGFDARAGTISSDYGRFAAWKSIDGRREESPTVPQLEMLVRGMLNKTVFLDLIRHFTVFEKTMRTDPQTGLSSTVSVKKTAAYHQYFAVNKAVEMTLQASRPDGNRKIGVVWHTQGSGKSLSMVFYTGKIVLNLDNPTVVVVTDRNDLDDQLFETFAGCRQLLRQEPVQAQSIAHLKTLLRTAGGGIIFTTLQKFSPEEGQSHFERLSERRNIVVIADEAHRSHYGFQARHITQQDGTVRTVYGMAKYLRDALPNASFIGFTATPIEKEDISTRSVFGNEIDIYDIEQSIRDGATVPIYYESRLARIQLKPEEKELLDEEVAAITEGAESTAAERAKAKWTQLEAIVGHPDRVKDVAADIVQHFEQRQEVFDGKAMIVCISRRTAVAMYEAILRLRPNWAEQLKVVMTSASSDPPEWQPHSTTKEQRREIAARFKNPNDPLKMVIVCDMWLTGFDVPCLHTMYIDKLMRGHTLMQAIARVNRIFRDKEGGLIVDYIGFASELKEAIAVYTQSGGRGTPTLDQSEAVRVMLEKLEVVRQMFSHFDYRQFFAADTNQKLTVILEAQEYILGLENGRERFIREVTALSRAFALSIPHPEALAVRDEVGFFQAVKARLVKYEPAGSGKSDAEIETAIRQIVDRALVSEGVVDIFDAAGIKKPDISILSDEFLKEIQGMERKNIAIEVLRKLLSDEIRVRNKKNRTQSKKLSEMLQEAIRRYQNHLLTTAQIIDELIRMAREIRELDKRGEKLHLSEEELAFYDALADNQSAVDVLGDETLRDLARVLVQRVKENTTIDWTIRDNVRAKLRVTIKRLLRQYGYPPDLQQMATDNVLKQAELLADDWSRQM
ncbi:MAG TPA: type I restriction endonuclease subunit R [Anaerohalosphaeraceae bacterium]|nr:type I restriction endonuclease subunit R [Anaerohalosphaeraceae bacterium]